MNIHTIRIACHNLGMSEPISIELDGTVWLGTDDDRTYLDMSPILEECENIIEREALAKQALLDRLGITAEEARMLLS